MFLYQPERIDEDIIQQSRSHNNIPGDTLHLTLYTLQFQLYITVLPYIHTKVVPQTVKGNIAKLSPVSASAEAEFSIILHSFHHPPVEVETSLLQLTQAKPCPDRLYSQLS